MQGAPRLSRELDRLRAVTGDVQPALRDIGSALEASTQQRFLDKQSPEGVAWEKHSTVTEEKRGVGADILRLDQHLFDSIGSSASSDKVAVGVNRIYGRIHQLGGQAGRGRKVTILARPYLGISRDDEREIFAIMSDHIEAPA